MQATKSQLRSRILAARRRLDAAEREREARDLARHAAALARPGETVCGYVPVGSEPGSLELIDVLVDRGAVVLLPVARRDAGDVPQPLEWGRYRRGELVEAPFGLQEPPPPWLTDAAVRAATLILVPALAVEVLCSFIRLTSPARGLPRTSRARHPPASALTATRKACHVSLQKRRGRDQG